MRSTFKFAHRLKQTVLAPAFIKNVPNDQYNIYGLKTLTLSDTNYEGTRSSGAEHQGQNIVSGCLVGKIINQFNYQNLRFLSTIPQTAQVEIIQNLQPKVILSDGPGLADFIAINAAKSASPLHSSMESLPVSLDFNVQGGRIYFETYGCQMNVNDLEIVLSILAASGYTERVDLPEHSDIILINTCAIRDNAESRVWQRLNFFKSLKLQQQRKRKKHRLAGMSELNDYPIPKIAVLGCMAERLKSKLLDAEKMVDVVCGPDAYRDLPRLLAQVDSGQAGVNVMLSLEETYADVAPVRVSRDASSAFVSVMRGCDNMCAFCIVPFTRGRERSRPIASVLREVRQLWEQGVREVVLLGQNVNSYRYLSGGAEEEEKGALSDGFSTVYREKVGGLRFARLLEQVAGSFPDMRVRFTSPHPKDFPDELLAVMRRWPNVCKSIHLPAQSGSSAVLARMRRGYSREAYLSLVGKIREALPGVALSSDFIAGFCGETEEDHRQTLSLIEDVGFDMAYMFAYSLREKTYAHRKYDDDVPEDVKKRRLAEVIETFRRTTRRRYEAQIGKLHLVLVEGNSKRAPETEFIGRNDYGHRVIFSKTPVKDFRNLLVSNSEAQVIPSVGDYVAVKITGTTSASLRGSPQYITTLTEFHKYFDPELPSPAIAYQEKNIHSTLI